MSAYLETRLKDLADIQPHNQLIVTLHEKIRKSKSNPTRTMPLQLIIQVRTKLQVSNIQQLRREGCCKEDIEEKDQLELNNPNRRK